MSVRWQKCSMDARVSSADLVQRNGFGFALCCLMSNEGLHGDDQLLDGLVSAPLDLLFGDEGEKALDLIDP